MPQPPSDPAPPSLNIFQGYTPDGTDLGVLKVEKGKLVLDMNDFDADFGVL